jgi:succinyl-diaminopimelate desuccinylase
MSHLTEFSERYLLARENSIKSKPKRGLCGLEVEWNLLDSQFHPLLTIGSGPDQISFVDYLRTNFIPDNLRDYSQLEVFHWMIEWATKPYYSPRGAIYESRFIEAVLLNSLFQVGREFDERLYIWHGNLPFLTEVNLESIPGSWHLAKRRYLERCINLYGEALATTGTHSNLSLPDSLFEWDFMQLPAEARAGGSTPPIHIDEFKSQFYITAAGLMRAFASLFVATSASTPFRAEMKNGNPVVYLTSYDSIRNLTFPNPTNLDLPDLYKSLDDYLEISYELVRKGLRFGNNNWTPVRARSFAEPVERIIDLTSDQLHDLYGRGLYVLGKDGSLEELVEQVEIQNLLARIDLPMARVEIRSDDGGNPLDIEIANLTLKHLLMLKIYEDSDFARSFKYSAWDVLRARNNEDMASKYGLSAEIKDPFTKRPVKLRDFLSWVLTEIQPLAEMLELSEDLQPLKEMIAGAPNEAQRLRSRVCDQMGGNLDQDCAQIPVPIEILQSLAQEREEAVFEDIDFILKNSLTLPADEIKLGEFIQPNQNDLLVNPHQPIPVTHDPQEIVVSKEDKEGEILDIAIQLIKIPSVTTGSKERIKEVHKASNFIRGYLENNNLNFQYLEKGKYPAILAGFPGQLHAPVMLSGHFDVVAPEPDDSQFIPRLEGDYLWGRGSADMKTVVATYLVWMKDELKKGEPYPPINLMLIGNEEIGELDAMGTPHVLEQIGGEGNLPKLFIAGERTEEQGNGKWGEICIENRGVMRFEVIARGEKGHTGTASRGEGLPLRLLAAIGEVKQYLQDSLTLQSEDNWRSQFNVPFIEMGRVDVFNIQPELGRVGFEIRPIPQDDLHGIAEELQSICERHGVELKISAMENGIACDPDNPYLENLIEAVRITSKSEPKIGKKLPGTSARFAPDGQGVVWGQSGLNPHARDERHYIPSIKPYYDALSEFARLLRMNN